MVEVYPIQTAVTQAAIQAPKAVVMVLEEADTRPKIGTNMTSVGKVQT